MIREMISEINKKLKLKRKKQKKKEKKERKNPLKSNLMDNTKTENVNIFISSTFWEHLEFLWGYLNVKLTFQKSFLSSCKGTNIPVQHAYGEAVSSRVTKSYNPNSKLSH